jgi:pimeloyl-ACP methyl ester carboxylesterase
VKTVISKDGTPIAYWASGSGPALVLVHGMGSERTRWAPVLPELERHFTVYALNRRGRGGSGDGGPYSLEQEFDDVAALVDSIGAPVFLLGHSYGAIVSLEAAARAKSVAALVLYEPPLSTETDPFVEPSVLGRLEGLLARGDREALMVTFLREVVPMPAEEVALLQAAPNWPSRLATAHTIPREQRATNAYRLKAADFANFRVPTLLLLGGESSAFFRLAIDVVKAALPGAKVLELPGQKHVAMNTAPAMFVQVLVDFFR